MSDRDGDGAPSEPHLQRARRPLSRAERRLLSCRARRAAEPPSGGGLAAYGSISLGCMLPLWGLTLLVSDLSWQAISLGWLGIWLAAIPLALWPAVRDGRRTRAARARSFASALERDEVETVRIRAKGVVEFEEVEDLGASWAFGLADGRIVFVSGQDFYAIDGRFPCDDFTIVDILGTEGQPVAWFLRCRGEHLAPAHRIPLEAQEAMRIPDHLHTMNGELEDLEKLLAPRPS